MPDITMCCNPICPLRDNCYRAMAEPSRYQKYSSFAPEAATDGWMVCKYHWPLHQEIPVRAYGSVEIKED